MNPKENRSSSNESVPIVHLLPQLLPTDVAERILRLFPNTSTAVAERLNQLRNEDSQLFGNRILRCIVFCASQYPEIGIERWVELARADCRDLIVAAEYDRAYNRLRDFNRRFGREDFPAPSRNA